MYTIECGGAQLFVFKDVECFFLLKIDKTTELKPKLAKYLIDPLVPWTHPRL